MENPVKRQSYPGSTSPPRWLGPVTWAGVGLIMLITLTGAILLRRGAADPPVAGPVVWSDSDLRWAAGPAVSLVTGREAWWIAPAALPEGAFTLDVRGRLAADSDPSAAWGIWLETRGGARVIYAISGEGYVTTRLCPASPADEGQFSARIAGGSIEDCPALRPEWRWMPYPRVLPPGTANTITLHQEPSGEIRLRLNGEQLGVAPVDRSGRWGVWARGGRSGAALLTWEHADLRETSIHEHP